MHSSEVIAIAELVEKEKHSNSDGVGVVSTATDALAGDGHDQPINFPAGDDNTHKLGQRQEVKFLNVRGTNIVKWRFHIHRGA